MRGLIDTNIILDVLSSRKGLAESSAEVWRLCETKRLDGYVCALSIPNIAYILRKELDPPQTKAIIDKLLLIFKIEDLKAADLQYAANMCSPDFEDAVQTACAVRLKADFIVTRNIRDFKVSPVCAVTPEQLLENIKGSA